MCPAAQAECLRYWMLELSTSKYSHMSRSDLSTQSHTHQKDGEKVAGAEVRLRVNWFFMCPNFYPRVIFGPSFPSPSSKYLSILASPPCFEHLPLIPLSRFSIFLLAFIFIPLLLPLYRHSVLLSLLLWASVFLTQ